MNQRVKATLFLKIIWKKIFILVHPIILSPLLFLSVPFKCLFVILLMTGLTISRSLPTPLVALIPLAIYPFLEILNAQDTALAYFTTVNANILTSYAIALAITRSRLHYRIAHYLLLSVKCNLRPLHLIFMICASVISTGSTNTTAFIITYPLMEASLKLMAKFGNFQYYNEVNKTFIRRIIEFGKSFTHKKDPLMVKEQRKPSTELVGYYLSIAYSAHIGSLSRLQQHFTKLIDIYDDICPDCKVKITHLNWFYLTIPTIVASIPAIWIFLQIKYMKLLDKPTHDNKEVPSIMRYLRENLLDLGPITYYEIVTLIIFFLQLISRFLQDFLLDFRLNNYLKLCPTVVLLVVTLFIIPSSLEFFNINAPKRYEDKLLTVEVLRLKFPWDIILIVGGCNAMIKGASNVGMWSIFSGLIEVIQKCRKSTILFVGVFMATVLTEFVSAASSMGLLLPIFGIISKKQNYNPLYFMIPVSIASSHQFCLPFTSAVNAIVLVVSQMDFKEMVFSGIVCSLICAAIFLIVFIIVGGSLYSIHHKFNQLD